MLQTIREHTQGWIAGLILTLIIFSFALWGVHSYFTNSDTHSSIAKVNGVEISKQQLTVAYDRLKHQIQNQYKNNPSLLQEEATIKQRALQNLVEVEVLKQASILQGFTLSDQQIDNMIQMMPEFQISGQFSFDRFQEVLTASMISTSEFLELIRTSLLIDQPKLGIMFTSFSLPNEAADSVKLVNQVRNFSYILIPITDFLKDREQVSFENVKEYYEKHKNEYKQSDQIQVEYLQLSLEKIKTTITPTDEILKKYYLENNSTYVSPKKLQLDMLEIPLTEINHAKQSANRLRKGDNINLISKQEKALLVSNKWYTLSQLPKELQQSASLLTQTESVSEPINTGKSWVVLRLNNIQESKTNPFEDVKNKVKEDYINHRAEEKYAELKERLADLTYENPDSLNIASTTMDLPIETSRYFTKDDIKDQNVNSDIISTYKKVRETAFSNDVLTLQNNSEVIQPVAGLSIVLRKKDYIPAKLLPISHVQKNIEDKLKMEKAKELAESFSAELKNKLDTGALTLKTIDKKYHYKINQTPWIGRYGNKIDPAILDVGFKLANNKPFAYGIAQLKNGFAVVILNGVKEEKKHQNEIPLYSEQIEANNGLLEYELYKNSQHNQANVKLY